MELHCYDFFSFGQTLTEQMSKKNDEFQMLQETSAKQLEELNKISHSNKSKTAKRLNDEKKRLPTFM